MGVAGIQTRGCERLNKHATFKQQIRDRIRIGLTAHVTALHQDGARALIGQQLCRLLSGLAIRNGDTCKRFGFRNIRGQDMGHGDQAIFHGGNRFIQQQGGTALGDHDRVYDDGGIHGGKNFRHGFDHR